MSSFGLISLFMQRADGSYVFADVFGCSLKILEKRNSTWVPIFGYMHQVPKVAALCIEKLYASGKFSCCSYRVSAV